VKYIIVSYVTMLTKVYKGKYFSKANRKSKLKVIAFDLDETLGSFTDLHVLWNAICEFDPNHTILITELLDLFPEFIRYGILPILQLLYHKKRENVLHKIYIYTNNQCQPSWTTMISNYLTSKIIGGPASEPLFDQIICAFKIDDKVIEVARTCHAKTHEDFIRCTMLPRITEVCFVDNTYYPAMSANRIYYIQPLSYFHSLSNTDMIERFTHSEIGLRVCKTPVLASLFSSFMITEFYKHGSGSSLSNYTDNVEKRRRDILVAQKIMYHIQEFLYCPTTRRPISPTKKTYTSSSSSSHHCKTKKLRIHRF